MSLTQRYWRQQRTFQQRLKRRQRRCAQWERGQVETNRETSQALLEEPSPVPALGTELPQRPKLLAKIQVEPQNLRDRQARTAAAAIADQIMETGHSRGYFAGWQDMDVSMKALGDSGGRVKPRDPRVPPLRLESVTTTAAWLASASISPSPAPRDGSR